MKKYPYLTNKNSESLETFTIRVYGEYCKVEIYDYSIDNPCFEIQKIVNGEYDDTFAYMGAKTRNAIIIKDGKRLKSTTYARYDETTSLWSPDEYYDHLIDEVAKDLLVLGYK